MRKRSSRANATDINKTPTMVRYVFIMELKSGPRGNLVGVLTTHRTLSENLSLKPIAIKVVDLKYNLVSKFKLDQIESFLEEWRENYFDYEWDIPYQFFE